VIKQPVPNTSSSDDLLQPAEFPSSEDDEIGFVKSREVSEGFGGSVSVSDEEGDFALWESRTKGNQSQIRRRDRERERCEEGKGDERLWPCAVPRLRFSIARELRLGFDGGP